MALYHDKFYLMKEILLFVFFLGVLFFNWPILEIFRLSLPYYFFSVWAIFIAVTGLLMAFSKKGKTPQGGNGAMTNSEKNRDV